MIEEIKKVYTKKDYQSDQEVKWCPGCGDYAILSAFQMAMAQLEIPKEDLAIIAGIGCSSRFPYYMSSFGLHTIHGRAPAFATGVKLQNPKLNVWVITGDGDGLSIGGNHLAHVIRRNVGVKIILFNNEIYGLTKGQFSPTSKKDLKTKSSPFGVVDRPFNPGSFILGAGATFYARTIDTDPKHMMEVFKAAHEHNGCAVIEVYQNCVIFNDKVHDLYTNKSTRDDFSVRVEKDKPLVFGNNQNKALKLEGFSLTIGTTEEANFVHNPANKMAAQMLIELQAPEYPQALGVIYQQDGVLSFEEGIHQQINQQVLKNNNSKRTMQTLLESGNTWRV